MALAAAIALAGSPAETDTFAAGAIERGEVVFQKCHACHSLMPGETGLSGPNLAGVVGRTIASVPGFEYSDALEALPTRGYRVWTQAALDAFLTSPEEFAPGTAMTFVGLPDAKERADLMAYLAATRDGLGRE